ncbi:MAG: chemotaxis protein CheW [Bacteroidota bacterium]
MNELNKSDTGSEVQIVIFKQGHEEYALSARYAGTVIKTPPITKMPQAPRYIKGMTSIDGRMVAIIDLEEKFNSKVRHSLVPDYTFMAENEEFKIGILVSEIPKVISVAAENIDESLSRINSTFNAVNYIRGIVRVDGRLVPLIDIFKVLDNDLITMFKRHTAA